MSNHLLYKSSESLKEKLYLQHNNLIKAYDKLCIHLQLLNLDLKRSVDAPTFHTNQVRIKHLETVESNLVAHIYFIEDLIKKIGGNYNGSSTH